MLQLSVMWGSQVLPVSQRRPVNPEGQTHVLGDTQVPPLLHPSSQKAGKRNRVSLVQFIFITWISPQPHKKVLNSCTLNVQSVSPDNTFKSSATALGGNTDTFARNIGL